MDNFNFKRYLTENKIGMYSRTQVNEGNALLDAETLGMEIAKAHPEFLRYRHDGETRKLQDAIFSAAGEILHNAGIPLQTVRGLAYDADWAMELVSATNQALESGDMAQDELEEINPADLGAPQAAADAKMQQQDDQNGDMVDNASMGTIAEDEDPKEQMANAYVNKQIPTETGLSKYLDLLNAHDWFYHFSDDSRAWGRGEQDKKMLRTLYDTLTPDDKQKALDAFVDKYLQQYNPTQFPGAEKNVKYLTTTSFNGAV